MTSLRRFDLLLLTIFFIFSLWLMFKTFGYSQSQHSFHIARHVVGDFALHLSLIRSFSLGDNFPAQLPYFSGEPLPYHYYFDLFIGFLEKSGVRIDLAINVVSAILFTGILFLIYKISQLIFVKSRVLGLLSVTLFVLPSSFTFIDFFKKINYSSVPSIFNSFFYLPDYIRKGPFDGSIISLFFTLNVYVNQRHLIAGLFLQLLIIYLIFKFLLGNKNMPTWLLICLGIVLGISSRIHTLAFFSSMVFLFFVALFFKKKKLIYLLLFPAGLIFFLLINQFLSQHISHDFLHFGYLSQNPLTLFSFSQFWMLNLGTAFFLIPLSYFFVNATQRKIFLSILTLFIIGNVFQLSFRIDHNHTLFNYFIIFANMYIAYFLFLLFKKRAIYKLTAFTLFVTLTLSGMINLMPIKNDFQLYVDDYPKNKFMQWIVTSTDEDAVFLAKQDLLDPITLSGRKNYLGAEYYLIVMGYNYSERKENVKKFFEIQSSNLIYQMRKEDIDYIVIPQKKVNDFPYIVNKDFLQKTFKEVYKDDNVKVYAI